MNWNDPEETFHYDISFSLSLATLARVVEYNRGNLVIRPLDNTMWTVMVQVVRESDAGPTYSMVYQWTGTTPGACARNILDKMAKHPTDRRLVEACTPLRLTVTVPESLMENFARSTDDERS